MLNIMNFFYFRKITIALILFVSIIIFGTLGYVLIEDYNYFDAIYMVIISITTVGFREIKPLSQVGRLFTAVLILVGIGSLGFIGTSIAESILEKIWSGKSRLKEMKKKIKSLRSHYIVCGFGRVGKVAIKKFVMEKVDFVIIENDRDVCDKIKQLGYIYLAGDASNENLLLEAGIKSASGLLALLSSDPNNLFIALTGRELNPTLHIIARAEDASSEKRMLQAGADRVISPFSTAGEQVANEILAITGKSMKKPKDFQRINTVPIWVNVQNGSSMIGLTIEKISKEMGREIIGLRAKEFDFIFPDPDTIIKENNILLVLDEKDEVISPDTREPIKTKKVVIIDDNPVILRLYVRLFQKAGFIPLTAKNGREGLELIIKEKPAAAIIDFMLPLLSGIEICKKVRQAEGCREIKLILFTSENQPEIKKQALDAGADEVVIKTSDAMEVIHSAIKLMRS